jgi:SAM-dependent methyltransferase
VTVAKLNIGCGQFYKEGYVNVDFDQSTKADIFHNLEECPYPFEKEAFEEITCDHVLEHLNNPFQVMKELHRIAKPGGQIIIRVPHASRGFTHPDHKRSFDFTFPYYFKPDFLGGYTGVKLEIKSVRLRWFAQPYLKKTLVPKPVFLIMSFLGFIINIFANLSPAICSRFWCFWVGGFEEIEFIFLKN